MMRLRIVIQRHALPITRVVWPINSDEKTISQLLEEINDIVPLESGDWGLEDYTVELPGGFECFHFAVVGNILKDGDELVIRPLLTNDLRTRRLSGRIQISTEGKHLVDGIAFGRPRLKNPADRPPVTIPPRKRQKILYAESAPDHEGSNLYLTEADEAVESDTVESDSEPFGLLEAGIDEGEDEFDDEDDNDFNPDDESDPSEDELEDGLEDGASESDTHNDRQIVLHADFDDADPEEEQVSEDINEDASLNADTFIDKLRQVLAQEASYEEDLNAEQIAKERSMPRQTIESLEEALPAILRQGSTSLAEKIQQLQESSPDVADSLISLLLMLGTGNESETWNSTASGLRSSAANGETARKAQVNPDIKSGSLDEEGDEESESSEGVQDEADEDPIMNHYDHNGFPAGSIISGGPLTTASKIVFRDDSSDSSSSSSSDSDSSDAEYESNEQSDSDSTSDPEDSSSEESDTDSLRRAKSYEVDKNRGLNGRYTSKKDESSDSDSSDEATESTTSSSDTSSNSDTDSDSDSDSESAPEETSSKVEVNLPQTVPNVPKSAVQAIAEGLLRPIVPDTTMQTVAKDAQENQHSRTLVPPGMGKKATRKRNQRRRLRNMLDRLVQKGIVPSGTTTADLISLSENQGANSEEIQNVVNFIRKNSIIGQGEEEAVDNDASVSQTEQSELAARQAKLLEALASNDAEEKGSGTNQQPNGAMSDVAMDVVQAPTPESIAEPNQRQRNKLDMGASRRLLFGALGMKTPKSKSDEEKIREELMKHVQPVPNPKEVEEQAAIAPEDQDPDAWRETINLSAVECCYEGIELSEPPFPFVQRWDPQQQGRGGKGKRSQRNQQDYYEEERPSKKRKKGRNSQQTYFDEEQYYNQESHGDDGEITLNYDEELTDAIQNGVLGTKAIEDDLIVLPSDLNTLPDLKEGQAEEGAIIAFKQLVMSDATNWQPQISAYRTAKVTRVLTSGELELTLAKRDREQRSKNYDEETGERVYGKFEVPDDEEDAEDDGFLSISFPELIEPKVVQTAPEQAQETREEPAGQVGTTSTAGSNSTSQAAQSTKDSLTSGTKSRESDSNLEDSIQEASSILPDNAANGNRLPRKKTVGVAAVPNGSSQVQASQSPISERDQNGQDTASLEESKQLEQAMRLAAESPICSPKFNGLGEISPINANEVAIPGTPVQTPLDGDDNMGFEDDMSVEATPKLPERRFVALPDIDARSSEAVTPDRSSLEGLPSLDEVFSTARSQLENKDNLITKSPIQNNKATNKSIKSKPKNQEEEASSSLPESSSQRFRQASQKPKEIRGRSIKDAVLKRTAIRKSPRASQKSSTAIAPAPASSQFIDLTMSSDVDPTSPSRGVGRELRSRKETTSSPITKAKSRRKSN